MENNKKGSGAQPDIRLLVVSLFAAIYLYFCLSYDLSVFRSEQKAVFLKEILKGLKTYGLTGNLYTLAIAAVLYALLTEMRKRQKRMPLSLVILSAVFGVLNAASLFLFHTDAFPGAGAPLVIFAALCVGWTLVYLLLSALVLFLMEKISSDEHASQSPGLRFFEKHIFAVSFCAILLGWLPWIVSYYPASMEWDVYDPIVRYLRIWKPTNHHPWFYAWSIGSAYKLGMNLGDKNMGVFGYIVVRALIMAAIYARCVSGLRVRGISSGLCLLTTLFFAVTPVWGAYAKHAFKDTIGAACFCWFVFTLIELIFQLKNGKLHTVSCLEFSAAALFSALFRNNAIYVVFPVVLLLATIVLWKKQKPRYALMIMAGFVCFLGYQYYIFNILHVKEGNPKEALSIPFQQTARTVKFCGDRITEEEKEIIGACLPYDDLPENYDPIISDPVKNHLHGGTTEGVAYLKVWLKMLPRFPKTYLEAFIAQSSGYYSFTPEYTEAQRYGPGSHANVGMTVFNWVKDSRFEDNITCEYLPEMGGMRSFLDDWVKVWHQLPILNLTDCKPLYTWAILMLGWLLLKRREYLGLLPVFACLLMVLTCVASPVNDCFRYYAPVAAAFPGLLALLKLSLQIYPKTERSV